MFRGRPIPVMTVFPTMVVKTCSELLLWKLPWTFMDTDCFWQIHVKLSWNLSLFLEAWKICPHKHQAHREIWDTATWSVGWQNKGAQCLHTTAKSYLFPLTPAPCSDTSLCVYRWLFVTQALTLPSLFPACQLKKYEDLCCHCAEFTCRWVPFNPNTLNPNSQLIWKRSWGKLPIFSALNLTLNSKHHLFLVLCLFIVVRIVGDPPVFQLIEKLKVHCSQVQTCDESRRVCLVCDIVLEAN